MITASRRAALAILVALAPPLVRAQAPASAAPIPPATPPVPAAGQPAPRPPEAVTFAEAVRRAIQASVNTLVAAAEIRRAEGLLWQVRSGALPSLFGNGTYTRLDDDRKAPGSTTVFVPRDSWNANAALQVPLVAPSRWGAWAHGAESVDVARASEVDVRRTSALVAARAYLAILAQKRVIDVSRSAREIAKARFDFAHARHAGGIGNAVDELRAEQQLATAEVQLASGQVGLVRAQEALGAIAGAEGALDAADEPAFEPRPGTDPVATAEAERVDVKAARARLTAAEHVRRDSWLDWLPTLLASGQVFYNEPAGITTPQTGWQVQFLLSLPIFEGGLRVGQLEERRALEEEARVTLDGTLRQARSDVRVALEEVTRQEGALAQARLAAERARAALQLTIEAYRAGATNDLDVSTAQQQARDADLSAVVAEDGVRQARLDLLSGLGQFP